MCFYTRPSTKLKFTEKKQGPWVLCCWNGFDLPLNALHNKYKNLKNKNTSTCKHIHTPSPNIDSLSIQTLTKCDRQIPTHAEERGISEKQAWPLAEEKNSNMSTILTNLLKQPIGNKCKWRVHNRSAKREVVRTTVCLQSTSCAGMNTVRTHAHTFLQTLDHIIWDSPRHAIYPRCTPFSRLLRTCFYF